MAARRGLQQFATTLANLREIATTAYFNVPKGYELLLPALRADADFSRTFFSRLRMLFYAAAGLRQEVSDAFEQLAIDALRRARPVGDRPRRHRDGAAGALQRRRCRNRSRGASASRSPESS